VLINLLHVARLDLLSKLPGHEFVVPDHVREEIDAITVFTELIVHIGRGEAACIAIAAKHGWCIASDEKRRFRREAVARIGAGRLLGTADIFVAAIGAGLLSVEEADADKLTLEERRFKMSFGSYRELVT
jgi:predicted nucleic acid-binding protein